jgi:hypothetical protein
MACNRICTPCFGSTRQIARHKQGLYPGGRPGVQYAQRCAGTSAAPIPHAVQRPGETWRAIRYRKKSQHCGRRTDYDGRSNARLPRRITPARGLPRRLDRWKCPDTATAKDPPAFNAHSQGGGGSGLVQSVFRSPARIPITDPRGKSCAPRRQAKNARHYHVLRARGEITESSPLQIRVGDCQFQCWHEAFVSRQALIGGGEILSIFPSMQATGRKWPTTAPSAMAQLPS